MYRQGLKLYIIPRLTGVWRYQRGNQNPWIEEEQTTQWPNEKIQKDKQRSTKHGHKTKDRVTRTPLKTGDELGCSWKVSSFCSIIGTRRVNLVTNPVISHKWGNGPWSVYDMWNISVVICDTLKGKINNIKLLTNTVMAILDFAFLVQ